jgi:hypothetical protein
MIKNLYSKEDGSIIEAKIVNEEDNKQLEVRLHDCVLWAFTSETFNKKYLSFYVDVKIAESLAEEILNTIVDDREEIKALENTNNRKDKKNSRKSRILPAS